MSDRSQRRGIHTVASGAERNICAIGAESRPLSKIVFDALSDAQVACGESPYLMTLRSQSSSENSVIFYSRVPLSMSAGTEPLDETVMTQNTTRMRDHVALIVGACVLAQKRGRDGAVTAIGIDPEGAGILPVLVRDDDWIPALARVPPFIHRIPKDADRPALLLFGFGIGEVDYLCDRSCIDQIASAVMSVYVTPGGDPGSRSDVEVIRRVSEDLEQRNIALNFIGEQFAWLFDPSAITVNGANDRRAEPDDDQNGADTRTPIFTVTH